MKRFFALFQAMLVLALLFSCALSAQTNFTGAVDSDYLNASNWDNGLPGPGNDAHIPMGQSVTWTATVPPVAQLDHNLHNEGNLLVNATALIQNVGMTFDNDGTFQAYGAVDIYGTVLVDGTFGCARLVVQSIASFINNTTFHPQYAMGPFTPTPQDGSITNYGYIENTVSGFVTMLDLNNSGTILNSGSFTFENVTLSTNEGVIDNQGTIDALTLTGYTNNGIIYNCLGTITINVGILGTAPETLVCPTEEVCDGEDNDLDGVTDEECGCTDPAACNYDPTAVSDDGSCGNTTGCTDSGACNYDMTAVCDDGSCTYPDGCVDVTACNYDATAGCDDGSCIYPGCTDLFACNFDPAAGCDDGSCAQSGCTHISACNYDATAGCDDGSCEFLTCRGCTSTSACNYDASASIDDGSCEYASCSGCTYLGATNYDATATEDDGSCTFALAADCPKDLNGDGTVGSSDLLEVLAEFGTSCPE